MAELAKRGPEAINAILQSAAKLEELADGAANGTGMHQKADLLYKATCGYGIAAKLAAGWPGRRPFPLENRPELTDEHQRIFQQYCATAVEVVRAAIAAGWEDFPSSAKNPDLAALHTRDEFQTLLRAGR